MREVTFGCPYEIPRSTRTRLDFKNYLESLAESLGQYGQDGRAVGLGFRWETHTGLAGGGLHSVLTMARRLNRALQVTAILSRQADVYLLECRIVYSRTTEPNVTIMLREG